MREQQQELRKLREPLKNVGGAALARQILQKMRSLPVVNEQFFAQFNDARVSKVIFQRFLRTQTTCPAFIYRFLKSANFRFNSRKNLTLTIIVGITNAVTLTACHRQTAEDSPAVTFETCTPPKGYIPIPESGCSFISVRENPTDSSSPLINIHFLRIKAVNANPKLDPLVLIQGGPGGSSQIMAYSLYRYFASVRQNRDLLFIDLRGTGESNPLNCPGLESITSQLTDKEALQIYRTLMNDCAKKIAKSAPFYSTELAVKDLETIRSRLGYQQFNLWGASYGSRIALKYAVEYPAFTRSLVLDGLAPRAISLPRFIARDANAAFAQLNRYCQDDHLCKQHYGDLTINAEKIIRHLQNAEIAQKPERISLPDPLNQKTKEWIFTPRRFAQLVISALYSRELTSLAPRALKQAADGNYQLLGTLSALAERNSEQLSVAEGLYYSVICNEDLTEIPASGTPNPIFMGVDLVEDKLAVCAHWPKAAPSQTTEQTTQPINRAPTLLLSGALDPVTPKIWADLVALTQLNHQTIEVPGGNHVVSTLGCLPNLIAQFINTPNTYLPANCTQDISPLPFYLGADPAMAEDNHKEVNKDNHD